MQKEQAEQSGVKCFSNCSRIFWNITVSCYEYTYGCKTGQRERTVFMIFIGDISIFLYYYIDNQEGYLPSDVAG